MALPFCDPVGAKLYEESRTGKRNLEVWLEIVQENGTKRSYIVGSDGFHAMHQHICKSFTFFQKSKRLPKKIYFQFPQKQA